MKDKKWLFILLGIGLLALVLLFIFTPRIDTDFPNIVVEETHYIKNNTDIDYLDKIISAGLMEVGMDTIYLTVLPVGKNDKISGTNLALAGRIIPGPRGSSQYIMQLEESMTFREIIKTVAHEIIHIQQYQSGRLIVNRNEDGSLTGFATWDGWNRYDVNKLKYHEYPWEIDAYKNDDELYEKMIRRLYGEFK